MKQIYFDSDEEITAIINKLESIRSDRLALIPPKRSTTLQSVVNLKLIQKAVNANDNELVLITRDPLVLSIAGQLGILTAPSLGAEPTVPQPRESRQGMPEAEIEGAEAGETDFTEADQAAETVEGTSEPSKVSKKPRTAPPGKTNKKVPDFNRFKKIILLGIVVLVAVGGFLWWALTMAPRAEIRIEGVARDVRVNTRFTLNPEAGESSPDEGVLAAQARQEGRTLSTTFEPTGTDTVGEKASGDVTVVNYCYNTKNDITIEQGTAFTSKGGLVFRNDIAFDVPDAEMVDGSCEPEQVPVSVTAEEIGSRYNIGPTSFTIEGYPSGEGGVYGESSDKMTGGESEEVSAVTKKDIERSRQKLLEQERASVRNTLRNQFVDDQFIIDASFAEEVTELTSEPPAGEPSQDDARLILQVTYTLLGVQREDMRELLEHVFRQQVEGGQEMGMIESGLEEAEIAQSDEKALSFTLDAAGVLGPDITEHELKSDIAGKSYGETIKFIESKPNVTTAEVNLHPLWVTQVPDEHDRIEITFEVADPDGNDSRD